MLGNAFMLHHLGDHESVGHVLYFIHIPGLVTFLKCALLGSLQYWDLRQVDVTLFGALVEGNVYAPQFSVRGIIDVD